MDGLPVDMTEEDVGLHPLLYTRYSNSQFQTLAASVI